MTKYSCLIAFLLLGACATLRGRPPLSPQTGNVTPGPMSCEIQGMILQLMQTRKGDPGSLCSRYPCRARVLILAAPVCGAAVSVYLNRGDTVEMEFAYTLLPTRNILPRLKPSFPGLKAGSIFRAKAEERVRPGGQGGFVIYGYQLP